MNTAIVVVSSHHGNTRKLVDAIAAKHEITVIDGLADSQPDLSEYDRIGFASGIDCGKFYPQMLQLMKDRLTGGKKVFFLYTYGMKRKGYTDAAADIVAAKGSKLLGEYGCPGFDTVGPLKWIGGIAKGHPNAKEIAGAVRFYESLGE